MLHVVLCACRCSHTDACSHVAACCCMGCMLLYMLACVCLWLHACFACFCMLLHVCMVSHAVACFLHVLTFVRMLFHCYAYVQCVCTCVCVLLMLLHGVACSCMCLHVVALFACFVVRARRVVTRS